MIARRIKRLAPGTILCLTAGVAGRVPGRGAGCTERLLAPVTALAFVARRLQSFKKFPPHQKAATFGIGQVMDQLTAEQFAKGLGEPGACPR